MSLMSIFTDLFATSTDQPASPAAGEAKPAIRGLTSMGFADFMFAPALRVRNDLAECTAHPAVYAGAVINLKWSDLEPSEGSYDFSTVETALNTVASYNAAYPQTPLAAKLRVFAGVNCPAWVYQTLGSVQLVSAAPSATTQANGATFTFAHFWTAAYETAWAALMSSLAATYDNEALVSCITISSASSHTAEPFTIGSNQQNAAALIAAGFTDAQWQQALNNAVQDYAAWQTTNLDFPFNPLLTLQSKPMDSSTTMPVALMNSFRSALGGRAIVSNHALRPSPPASDKESEIWAAQSACGAPITFQTAGPGLDMDACVTAAVGYGCTELEMWDSAAADGPAHFDEAALQALVHADTRERQMIALVVVFCLGAGTHGCIEQRRPMPSPLPMACMLAGQQLAQEFINWHPQYRLLRWRCEVNVPRQTRI